MKPDVIPPIIPGCCVQCGASLVGKRSHAILCSDVCATLNGRRKKRQAIKLFITLGVKGDTLKALKKNNLTVLTQAMQHLNYAWDIQTQNWVLTK